MLAIYKREVKAYLQNVIGWLFMAATLFFLGLYYFVYNLLSGYPQFAYAISGSAFIFLITVPILTMRIMAEERRSKTDQLILTAPVSVGKIVVGKYVASLTMFAIPIAISCVYPLILSRFGTVPMGESYAAILGYFLFGAAAIAIGLFVSSLVENQIVAAVISFVVLFLGYMMPSLCSLISSTGNFLTNILGCYDINTPFYNLVSGTIDLTAVLYYVTLTALFLFLTSQMVQKRRYSVSVRSFALGAYSTGTILVAIAVVVLLNLVAGKIPEKWTKLDVTYNKLFTLTDETKEYLSTMDEDVTIYVIARQEDTDDLIKSSLTNFQGENKHITVTYVDPDVSPNFYKTYTSSAPTSQSLIVVSDKRNKVVSYSDMYAYTTSIDYTTYQYTYDYTGYDGEGQIVGAIDYVLGDDMPKLYSLSGHGETDFPEYYIEALSKANMEFETINLMNYDAIPEDASGVILYAPRTDYSEDDISKLLTYLDQGGKIIYMMYVNDEELPNLEKLMNYMELSTGKGMIFETSRSYYYQTPFYLLPKMTDSIYTTGVSDSGYYTFSPYNCGIIVPEENTDETITYDTFLKTSTGAFLRADYAADDDYTLKDTDVEGQYPIGIAATKTVTTTDEEGAETSNTATLVVYASAVMFTQGADEMVSYANQKVFINTVSSFADKVNAVSIPVKNYEMSKLMINQSTIILLGILQVIALPLIGIVVGIVIWARRRKY